MARAKGYTVLRNWHFSAPSSYFSVSQPDHLALLPRSGWQRDLNPRTRCVSSEGFLFPLLARPPKTKSPNLPSSGSGSGTTLVRIGCLDVGAARVRHEMQSSLHMAPPAFPANGENEGRSCQRPIPHATLYGVAFSVPSSYLLLHKASPDIPFPPSPQSGPASDPVALGSLRNSGAFCFRPR
jgi:hypothetical protein